MNAAPAGRAGGAEVLTGLAMPDIGADIDALDQRLFSDLLISEAVRDGLRTLEAGQSRSRLAKIN